ncbi:MAG: hypothetical protein IKU79_08315 [Bacteroidaceae bacterium]|nr:hypothetical protein [Bacteroidaceae bacterium]
MSNQKKYILIGIGVVVLLYLLFYIGGSDNSTTQESKELILKAAQTEIKGDLKGCYEVVDKNYKVKFAQKSYDNDVVTIELKRTNKELPYDRNNVVIFPEADNSSAENCAGFGIEILNVDGDVIDKKIANATPYSWDEMTAALQLLSEETTTIAFHFEDLSEAVSFRITSLIQKNEKRKSSIETEVKSLVDVAKEVTKLNDDEDLKEAKEEAEKVLENAEKTLEVTGKMLDLLKE